MRTRLTVIATELWNSPVVHYHTEQKSIANAERWHYFRPNGVAKMLPGPEAGHAVLYNAPPIWKVEMKWFNKGHRNQRQNLGETHQ